MPRFIEGSVTQVWPNIWVGSGMIKDPRVWVHVNKLAIVNIMSKSTFDNYGWGGVCGAIPLYFNDSFDGLCAGQVGRLLKIVSTYHSDQRVAFLCQAGLNRSSFAACLFRWWTTGDKMAHIMRELIDARVKAGAEDVLCNDQFRSDLLSFDRPLSDAYGEPR